MREIIAGVAALGGFAGAQVVAADKTVEQDTFQTILDPTSEENTNVTDGTFTVHGELTVQMPHGTFRPDALVVDGNGSYRDNGGELDFDHVNGRVFLNAGTIDVGSLSVGGTSEVHVNTLVEAGGVANSGKLLVNADLAVGANTYSAGDSDGIFMNDGRVELANGAKVTALEFHSAMPGTLAGNGMISSPVMNLATTIFEPGDGATAGTVTLDSTSEVSLASTFFVLDVYGGSSVTADRLALTGAVNVEAAILVLNIFDNLSGLMAATGPIDVITASSVTGTVIAEPQAIYDGDVLVGTLTVGQDADSVFLEFVPVPEPTLLALATPAVLMLSRRRRAR